MVRNRDGDGIKSNLIVTEVQKRPCLFDSNDPQYGDRAEKAKCWEEVCSNVVPGWSLLGLEQKFAAGKEIQKRWRSIRDSFTKSYRQGKCVLPEQCPPGSRRMQYHQQMAFLLSALQHKKPRFSCPTEKYDPFTEVPSSPQYYSSDELSVKIKTEIPDKPLDLKKTERDLIPHLTEGPNDKETQTVNKQEDSDVDHKPTIAIKVDTNSILPEDNFDDDKLFMNSLVPMFKKMDDDSRLLCRIEVLKVIRLALQGRKCFDSSRIAEDRCTSTVDSIEEVSNSTGSVNGTKTIEATASSLSMVTRSADGSRPVKRKRVHSPSPVPSPPKKRGPGRPRKVRPPTPPTEAYNLEEDMPKRTKSLKRSKEIMLPEPQMSELDRELSLATSVDQLKTPTFMKMYNLERSKTAQEIRPSTSEQQKTPVTIKVEPTDNNYQSS